MKGFPRFVWVLLGLLAISAALLSLGQREMNAKPSALSYGPSGVSAFSTLLQRSGYKVRIDLRSQPKIGKNEVAVAFRVVETARVKMGLEEDYFPAAAKPLMDDVRQGADAIVLAVKDDFVSASRALAAAKPGTYETSADSKPVRISAAANEFPQQDPDAPTIGLWFDQSGDSIVSATKLGKGRLVEAYDGLFLTNRFIDRQDHATAALRLVSLLARPGDTVVFVEATIGNVEDPSLMEAIGPWAVGAWQQLLFLGAVVVYTLGKRFGIPDESRTRQAGARELLDGLTDTYQRGRHTRAAMGAALDRADQELRRALRLPRDATQSDRDELLAPSLVSALVMLKAGYESDKRIQGSQALELIAKVRTETDDFLTKTRRGRKS